MKKIAGIYKIHCKTTDKVYIGKTSNFTQRKYSHKYHLTREVRNPKTTNRYLYNAVQKYGWDNFKMSLIECFIYYDEAYARQREFYWMDHYQSYLSDKGYNLRRDSKTKMIVHPKTRKRLSYLFSGERNPNYNNKWTEKQKKALSRKKKQMFLTGELFVSDETRKKISIKSSELWKDNKKKRVMADKVSKSKTIYKFYQYDKEGNLIKIWSSVKEILDNNPSYKRHNIYSAASGAKPTIYGYIWKKKLK